MSVAVEGRLRRGAPRNLRAGQIELQSRPRHPEWLRSSTKMSQSVRIWARRVSNLRPLACEASALPLSYAPWALDSIDPRRDDVRRIWRDARCLSVGSLPERCRAPTGAGLCSRRRAVCACIARGDCAAASSVRARLDHVRSGPARARTPGAFGRRVIRSSARSSARTRCASRGRLRFSAASRGFARSEASDRPSS